MSQVAQTYDVVVSTEDERVGVLSGVQVRPREVLELPLAVAPGARIVFPRPTDPPFGSRIGIRWEGVGIGSAPEGGQRSVPTGVVTLEFFARDQNFVEQLLDTRTRTLSAGEEWRVELPR